MTTWTGWLCGFGVAVLGLLAASCGEDEPGRPDATDVSDVQDGVDEVDGVDGVDSDSLGIEISDDDVDVGNDGVDDGDVGEDGVDAQVGFAFEQVEVSGGTAVWGAVAVGGWLIGGVNNGQTVISDIAAATLEDGILTVVKAGEAQCAALLPVRDVRCGAGRAGGRRWAWSDVWGCGERGGRRHDQLECDTAREQHGG